MQWTKIPLRTRLLICHWYFDISFTRWTKILHSGNLNPFTTPGLATLRPGVSRPGDWGALLKEISPEAVTYLDSEYPPALTELGPKRPPVIYIKGNRHIPPIASLVAIVGTRNPSHAGRRNAELFAGAAAGKGLGIVSGLARGIDAIAHRCALKPYTLAVLGSGVNSIYPRENTELAQSILTEGGTILSPFPDSQPIQPTNFPRRNLLIAALSAGTIVIEGAESSGANITGRESLALGHRVIALLQDFRSNAGRGAMQLLEAGADHTRDPDDALRTIAGRWPNGLVPLTAELGSPVLPPLEFTLDEWIDRYGDTPLALRELEERVHNGTVMPMGGGVYRTI